MRWAACPAVPPVTKQEYVSQNARERLFFAEKIADYLDTLSRHADFEKAVNQVLASVGDFYQADRAYLFEPAPEHDGHWNNTFEWCAQGVVPQRDALQRVAPQAVSRWMEIFKKEQSVIILNLAPLQQASPHEWAVLERQNIQRLIVAPLRENGTTIGFIGVNNPCTCIHDDAHVRVLLQHSNEDLLQSLQVGFWSIRRDQGRASRMIVNDTMEKCWNSSSSIRRFSATATGMTGFPRRKEKRWIGRWNKCEPTVRWCRCVSPGTIPGLAGSPCAFPSWFLKAVSNTANGKGIAVCSIDRQRRTLFEADTDWITDILGADQPDFRGRMRLG